MSITLRGILLLFLAAPLIALGTWLPSLEWVAGLYVLLALALFAVDWRLSGNIDRFQISREPP